MADKLTTTRILAVGLEYTKQEDGNKKTVYIKIPNPTSEFMTESGIKSRIEPLITAANPVLLTPDGTTFAGYDAFVTAYTEVVESIDFDIGVS